MIVVSQRHGVRDAIMSSSRLWFGFSTRSCACHLGGTTNAFAVSVIRHARASTSARVERTLTLNSGAQVPTIGLGTWLSKPGTVDKAVESALRVGYRHIDCAYRYANEAEIGNSIQRCIREGVVKREDVFIASKLWVAHHAYEDVLPACQKTLRDLKLDYLDLYLSHWPLSLVKRGPNNEEVLLYNPELEARCWEAMEGLVKKGLVKAIGVSNFTITKTERLLQTAKIVPAVNQVEYHPYLQQEKLKQYCNDKGILVECYSPLGNPQNPYLNVEEPVLMEDPVIKEIASKHRVSIAQVCIAFCLHRGNVVIPKSVTPERIAENFEASKLKLDEEDMMRLSQLGSKNVRYVHGDFFPKREWSDSTEYLWDKTDDERFVLKNT